MAKRPPRPIDDQVVVITGASSGIGRETALLLASQGAKVVVAARREDPLDDLVSEIELKGGEARSIPTDVSSFEEVEALAQGTVDAFGRIDTWVNNAGVLIIGEFEKTNLDEARRLFDVNYWGQVHGVKAALAVMRGQGYGNIINVTSVTAKRPLPLMTFYSSSKSALNGLYEGLQTEIKDSDIYLCTVMPATIDTPLYENARSKEGLIARPAPPIYPPAEVAKTIAQCAVSPKREMFAGPAGFLMAASNAVIPGVLDKVLAVVGPKVELGNEPEPARGNDNVDAPRPDSPATSSGGWRGRRYKAADVAARIGLGLVGLMMVRRLVRR